MERLADRAARVRNRELECLRDVVSVDVMHSFHTEIGKDQLFTVRELPEHCEIEVARRVDRRPARTDDVPGMQNRRSNHSQPCCLEQVLFDRRFPDSVIAERLARLRLRGRHDGAVPVHPGRPTVQQQRIAFFESANEMLRTLQRKANQIDDDIRTERGNAVAEGAGGFLARAIDLYALYFAPGLMGLIRLAHSAARRDYFVSGSDKPGDQVGADVAGSADDDDANGRVELKGVLDDRREMYVFSSLLLHD
jgi:hypothetical protein